MDVVRATRRGMSRRPVNSRRARKNFSRTARKSRRENYVSSAPMRGGIRL